MKYIKYFLYILEHKINVFKVCWKKKMYIHAFIHDLSKFLPDEFFLYVNWFYGDHGKDRYNSMLYKTMKKKGMKNYWQLEIEKNKKAFDKAVLKHYIRNKHHWNYWLLDKKYVDYEYSHPFYMFEKYIKQMICDWEAMGLKFGDTAKEYYLKNKDKILLHSDSRKILEKLLEVNNEK